MSLQPRKICQALELLNLRELIQYNTDCAPSASSASLSGSVQPCLWVLSYCFIEQPEGELRHRTQVKTKSSFSAESGLVFSCLWCVTCPGLLAPQCCWEVGRVSSLRERERGGVDVKGMFEGKVSSSALDCSWGNTAVHVTEQTMWITDNLAKREEKEFF